MIVMKMAGMPNGESTPYDGMYLRSFDFEAFNGIGEIDMTLDIKLAQKFGSMSEAFAFYNTIPKCKPFRPDDKPNKPLTATNWEFLPYEDAAND